MYTESLCDKLFLPISAALTHSSPDSNFFRSPPEALKWSHRKQRILAEILRSEADVICLEEVDHFHDFFQPELSQRGFEGLYRAKDSSPCIDMQPNNGPDGSAVFFRSSKFSLVEKKEIVLKGPDGHDSSQIAVLVKLEPKSAADTPRQKKDGDREAESETCSPKRKKTEHHLTFCVAVAHLKAKTGHDEYRLAQGKHLQSELASFAQGLPAVVCGDFNAQPTELVYQHFSSKGEMKLASAYTTANKGKEPPFTSWKFRPSKESKYAIDYIWYTCETLRVNGVWSIPTEADIGKTALPCLTYPSDHLAICAALQFCK